ncbi:hypothetical protein RJ639_004463 [Escallonia herrerae]|uniref:Uncharacterized protein n=1 Tax=Escallonia herrerae TaxID=1293975 RepID=A0AA88W5G7_9ASTE|nr:hypothetical protein RJ639_004463 [Escallonia herrerae]
MTSCSSTIFGCLTMFMIEISRLTCSVIPTLINFSFPTTFMATLLPVCRLRAWYTLAKLPWPSTRPSSYLPCNTPFLSSSAMYLGAEPDNIRAEMVVVVVGLPVFDVFAPASPAVSGILGNANINVTFVMNHSDNGSYRIHSPTTTLKKGELHYRLNCKLVKTSYAYLTREIHELKDVVNTLQKTLDVVIQSASTNQPRLDSSDLRLRLISRSSYSRRYKSKTELTYQPEGKIMDHVIRNGSCYRCDPSVDGSTNSSPIPVDKPQGQHPSEARRHQGRIHHMTSKNHPRGQTSRKLSPSLDYKDYLPQRRTSNVLYQKPLRG